MSGEGEWGIVNFLCGRMDLFWNNPLDNLISLVGNSTGHHSTEEYYRRSSSEIYSQALIVMTCHSAINPLERFKDSIFPRGG